VKVEKDGKKKILFFDTEGNMLHNKEPKKK